MTGPNYLEFPFEKSVMGQAVSLHQVPDDMARRLIQDDCPVVALTFRGHTIQGRPVKGMLLLDDALVGVLQGNIDHFVSGLTAEQLAGYVHQRDQSRAAAAEHPATVDGPRGPHGPGCSCTIPPGEDR